MDLVDEQHIAFFEIGQDRRQVARLGDHRPGRGAEADAEFARHDLRQRRLAEPRRSGKEHMVERFAPCLGGFDKDTEVGAGLLLTDELFERQRTKRRVLLVAGRLQMIDETVVHRANSLSAWRINSSAGASSPAFFSADATAAPAWV